jgi:hypothetical protein
VVDHSSTPGHRQLRCHLLVPEVHGLRGIAGTEPVANHVGGAAETPAPPALSSRGRVWSSEWNVISAARARGWKTTLANRCVGAQCNGISVVVNRIIFCVALSLVVSCGKPEPAVPSTTTITAPPPCPEGSYCHGASVQPCPAGYICTGGGAPQTCSAGTFCPAGATAPTPCPPGHLCVAGAKEPVACMPRYYCPAGSEKPTLCPAGSLCSQPKLAAPEKPCDAGSFCPAGSSTAQECIEGNFCAAGSAAPVPCRAGTYCPRGAKEALPCPAGFFCNDGVKPRECPCCPQGSAAKLDCPAKR